MPDVFDLYPRAPAAPQQSSTALGPLQMLDVMGRINALQQFQSRQAVGEEAQRAIHGGAFNPSEYRSGISRRPDAALAAPEAIGHSLAMERQGIDNATALFEQFAAQNNYAQAQLQSLANIKNPTHDDVIRAGVNISRQADARGVPSSVLNAVLSSVLNNPRGIAAGAKDLQNRVMGAATSAQRVAGPPGPGGEPTSTPLGSNPSDVMPIGLPPGGAESAQTMQKDLERAKGFGQEMFPWEEALTASNNLEEKYGKGFFAPGAKGRQDMQSYIYGLSPTIARWLNVDEDKIKDFAKADKYLTQAVQARAGGFGVHTDAGLATTISGSPNVSVNDLAVKDVIKASIALRRAEQVQSLTASKAGGPRYNEEAAKWPANHDIRALTLDKLDPDARAKLLGSLKKGTPEYAKFNRTLREAYDTGVMSRPGAQEQ